MVFLLIVVGTVGLQVLSESNRRTNKLVELQRKIAAYRQLQYDTAAQLHSVASALVARDGQTLNSTLRQLDQFGYDYDRLQFIARDEAVLLDEVRTNYDQFVRIVRQVIDLIRTGKAAEARNLQLSQASPIAERLDLITNQLVNEAEADMVAGVEASAGSYRNFTMAHHRVCSRQASGWPCLRIRISWSSLVLSADRFRFRKSLQAIFRSM